MSFANLIQAIQGVLLERSALSEGEIRDLVRGMFHPPHQLSDEAVDKIIARLIEVVMRCNTISQDGEVDEGTAQRAIRETFHHHHIRPSPP